MTGSMLREYYPVAVAAFDDLAGRDAHAVLSVAPSPEQGFAFTVTRVEALVRRVGRQRYVRTRATEIVAACAVSNCRPEPVRATPTPPPSRHWSPSLLRWPDRSPDWRNR
jgi:hypothetical protein